MKTANDALRIIFMGTPEFAVESLKMLVEHDVNVVAVITAPDRPKGRGKAIATSPVKDYAVSVNIPLLQPTNLKNAEFLEELKSYRADLQVVVAFRMLPVAVWDMPRLGTFNLHASLLPQYRGAAPINWAIMNGETRTGVTTFFLKHEIDTGGIIFQEDEMISEADSVGDLYERLMHKGARLVLKTIKAIANDEYTETPQKETANLKKAPKIYKETCEINWDRPAKDLYNFIRGLSPYPAAWTTISGKTVKIYETEVVTTDMILKPGEFATDDKSWAYVGTNHGVISILSLQPEGKRRMQIKEFLAGNASLFH
ncbi:MAG: methionyl-tRNA formyltransferase [Cyclobacteriaceae bacterium]